MKANLVVDTLGMFCPLPVIKTADAMRPLDVGGIVEVIADDPAIELDMPAWCTSNGHEIMSRSVCDGVYRFFVRKSK
jgi:TusA-related sulfurtransferase